MVLWIGSLAYVTFFVEYDTYLSANPYKSKKDLR